MREETAEPDQMAARIAARQYGIVTTGQLLDSGIGKDGVMRRARRGWLHRLHRGVYAVGHPNPSAEGRYMAAVLACGTDAVLSHRSAAAHWRLLGPGAGDVHVTIPDRGSRSRRKGIHLHRSSVLPFSQLRRPRGIPVTSVERTLADLRRTEPAAVARQAARQAGVLGLNTGDEGVKDRTRSELERRFLWLCRRHRLPVPEVNVRLGASLVDFLWRDLGLVIETDGWGAHRGRSAFEADRMRDAELRLAGYEVLRFSYNQVFEHAEWVVEVLRSVTQSGSAVSSRYARQNRRGMADRHDL